MIQTGLNVPRCTAVLGVFLLWCAWVYFLFSGVLVLATSVD